VIAVVAGVGVVASRNPLFSLLSLLGAFFCLSGIYLLAGFQFLAATQLLVYAGAIMVLFLFVIMLLNLGNPGTEDPTDVRMFSRANAGLMVLAAGALLFVSALAIRRAGPLPVSKSLPEGGLDPIPGIANEMFGRYLLPFEAISVLLLATAVAVMVLAKRDNRTSGGHKA
jgi:NADH-quinone oxidoreductase subunit J